MPRGALLFDSARGQTSKPYLLCLLARDNIFAAGVHMFRSRATDAYFKLLLHSPQKAREDMPAI